MESLMKFVADGTAVTQVPLSILCLKNLESYLYADARFRCLAPCLHSFGHGDEKGRSAQKLYAYHVFVGVNFTKITEIDGRQSIR